MNNSSLLNLITEKFVELQSKKWEGCELDLVQSKEVHVLFLEEDNIKLTIAYIPARKHVGHILYNTDTFIVPSDITELDIVDACYDILLNVYTKRKDK